MARIRADFIGGVIANDLSPVTTTLQGARLSLLPTIAAPDIATVILDPNGLFGEPEIVHITAHTVSTPSATVVRGQEGTIARAHVLDNEVPWLHGPTKQDWDSKSDHFNVTSTKVGDYTALPWDLVVCDPTTTAFTITLPLANVSGQTVAVRRLTSGATPNNITVARAGSDTINVGATSANIVLDNEVLWFTSNGAGNWTIAAGQKSLTSLDNRYSTLATNQTITGNKTYTGLATFKNKIDFAGGPFFSPEYFINANGGDHYLGWKALVVAVNAAGSGIIVCENNASYFLNSHIISAGPNANGVSLLDLQFQNLSGITILGNGATWAADGAFKRMSINEETGSGSTTQSYEQVLHLRFLDCSNVYIENITLDGNVDQMTRTSTVTEDVGHGLSFYGVFKSALVNVEVHHWNSDGIYFGSSGTTHNACHDAMHINVNSHNNGRQGMSVVQLRDGTFYKCHYDYTGSTGGTYGAHAPQKGVDIEPNSTVQLGGVDVNTGNLLFDNCTFVGNSGGMIDSILNGNPVPRVDHVTIRNCTGSHPTGAGSYAIILAISRGIIEDCDFDLGEGEFYPTWSAGDVNTSTLVKDTLLWAGDPSRGIVMATASSRVRLNNVRLVGYHTMPYPGGDGRFPFITGATTDVENCYFFVPAAYYDPLNADSKLGYIAGYLENCRRRGNRIETDLVPSSNGTTRIVTDGVTNNGSAIVTSATAAFTSSDVGSAISGAGILASTTIISVDSGSQVHMSTNATGSGSGVTITIAGTQHFYFISTGTDANDELFLNAGGYNNPPMRPSSGSSWDPSVRWANGSKGVGLSAVWQRTSSTAGSVHTYGTVAPSTGTWRQGDIVWNGSPSEAGSVLSKYVVLGWTCTVAGTPGTWLPIRTLTGN